MSSSIVLVIVCSADVIMWCFCQLSNHHLLSLISTLLTTFHSTHRKLHVNKFIITHLISIACKKQFNKLCGVSINFCINNNYTCNYNYNTLKAFYFLNINFSCLLQISSAGLSMEQFSVSLVAMWH